MFPRNSSVIVRVPSLLPGSGRPRSPAFCGTMNSLRLPRRFSRPSLYRSCRDTLRWLPLVCSALAGKPGQVQPGCCSTGSSCPVLCLKDVCGSLMFPGNPIVPMPCSQTPAGPLRFAISALRCCPRCSDCEGSNHIIISRLNHTACALAVYASCRHHWRLRKTRFRGWLTFSGWDCLPTEFL